MLYTCSFTIFLWQPYISYSTKCITNVISDNEDEAKNIAVEVFYLNTSALKTFTDYVWENDYDRPTIKKPICNHEKSECQICFRCIDIVRKLENELIKSEFKKYIGLNISIKEILFNKVEIQTISHVE